MNPVHSKFIDSISHFTTDICTIQEYIVTGKNSLGQETKEWQDKADHIDIACCVGSTKDTEIKLPDRIRNISSHVAILLGYYPDVTKKMKAIINGAGFVSEHEIVGVVNDGYKNFTKLFLEMIKL